MTQRRTLKGALSGKTISSGKPKASTITKTTMQTVRINGIRTTIMTCNGKLTTKAAFPFEWELQAVQVRALGRLPEYVHTVREVRPAQTKLQEIRTQPSAAPRQGSKHWRQD
ncbi:hypothetical protein [Brucella gallinifaecis]|uniref:hypothetical protein n=1 Tax=Brucella gallinifaecis TaxID=215590 RepID=UPI002361295F|nr:hypothetical protein [Brucella gallinifaecis]